jgi:glycine oxidase
VTQRSRYDVAVIGAGVIGLTIAWRAAQRGMRVTLLDRGEPGGGASWVAAGMLAPVTEARLTELPLLELGVASARLYSDLVLELREQTGIDPGYERCGTLVVARDRDDAEALERELEVHRRLGLPVARLRPSEARRLEPALAPTTRLALEVEDDHAIDPRRLTAALVRACAQSGVELRTSTPVESIEQLAADQVVVAAGAWADALGGIPDEARVPIHPVKGQLLRLHDPAGPGLLRRVLRTGGGYLVPRGDGRYVLGATMEERGFDTTVTAGAMFELLRDAIEVVPGVSELVVDELVAGLRPATADGLPAIGPGSLKGLHWAVGHYRNGILLAPITAQLILSALEGEELPAVAAPFAPARFTSVSITV